MSKRLFLVPLFFVLIALPAFSAESGPSNTVGFITFDAPSGQFTPFAFPFSYYNEGHVATTAIADILMGNFNGGNPATGDRIWDQNTLSYIYRTSTGTWSTAWINIVPGHAYWSNIKGVNDVLAITAGEVDMSPLDLGTMSSGNFNPVGLREAGVVMPADMNLVPGFTGGNPATSDRLWDQNTLSYAYYNSTSSAWVGLATGIEPGHALWVQVKSNHPSFNWIYTPTGNSPVVDVLTPVPSKPAVPRTSGFLQSEDGPNTKGLE